MLVMFSLTFVQPSQLKFVNSPDITLEFLVKKVLKKINVKFQLKITE